MTILATLAACALALLPGQTADKPNDANAVAGRDRELNRLIAAGDAKAAADFYLEDFVLTTSRGQSKHKGDMLAEIGGEGLHFDLNETTDVTVREHGDVAALTGTLHQRGVHRGKAFDAILRVTDTWLRTRSGWQLLAGHASAAP